MKKLFLIVPILIFAQYSIWQDGKVSPVKKEVTQGKYLLEPQQHCLCNVDSVRKRKHTPITIWWKG